MIRKFLGICLLLVASTLSWAAPGNTVEKFALVIANRDYQKQDASLSNTIRDAEVISQSLRKLDFTVTQLSNLTRPQMVAEIAAFASNLPQGATALIYYAGHGMQIGGANYLIPVDMELTGEQSVPLKSYPLNTLLERLAASKAAVNLVVLDACRNNPFQPRSVIRYRSFDNLGLAPVQSPRGTFIAYSTAPGQLAADGKGSNSLYAITLARTLLEPSLELREVFERVGAIVRKTTLDDQIPWYESSLTEKYYFLPPNGITVQAGKPLPYANQSPSHRALQRSLEATAPLDSAHWFELLEPGETDALHREIEQRAKSVSADDIPELLQKAQGGNLVAQTTLGLVLREGYGDQRQSNTQAIGWLSKAAEEGFPIAQIELGEMYYAGKYLPTDKDKSRYWLEQAGTGSTRARLDLLQLRVEQGDWRSLLPRNTQELPGR